MIRAKPTPTRTIEMDVNFGDYSALFGLLEPKYCKYHPPKELFRLKEKKKGGEADISVSAAAPCFCIEDFDKIAFPVLWEDENGPPEAKPVRQHADHLVFLYDKETRRWTLHVFEMTAKINWYKWDGKGGRCPNGSDDVRKIQNQFNGAVIRAYMILGALRGADFERIYLHCVYRRAEDLSEKRTVKGRPAPPDYLNKPVKLPYFSLSCSSAPPEILNAPLQLNVIERNKTTVGVLDGIVLNL